MQKREYEALTLLLEQRKYKEMRAVLQEMQEVDIAQFLEELPPDQAARIFRTLPKEQAAEIFSNFSVEVQAHIITSMTDQELTGIIEDLSVDDAVDMLEELPANVVKRVLQSATSETRQLINQFLKYPDGTAGSIMTAEFIDLKENMTVAQAIAHIRRNAEDKETISISYIMDARRKLIGVISIRELLMAQDDELVRDKMQDHVIQVTTTDDYEQVVQLIAKYDLLSLPVVDGENRLVGIVTVDDVVDVIEEENTHELEQMAAMLPSEKPYLKTSAFTLAKNRVGWLLFLMLSGIITGGILARYEAAFAAMPLLVTFIPMLTDTGGNAGSQSSTMVIRGMSLGEIQTGDLLRVLRKEFVVSCLVGFALAGANWVRLMFTYPGQPGMVLTVSIAMFCTVLIAKTVGGVLPILAKFLHADPAVMAAPLITTVVDAFSLIIYFNIAQRLLHL